MVNGFNHLVLSATDFNEVGVIVNKAIIEKLDNIVNYNTKAIYLELYNGDKNIFSSIYNRFVRDVEIDGISYNMTYYVSNYVDIVDETQGNSVLYKEVATNNWVHTILF